MSETRPAVTDEPSGKIITFYSYKGGVGRSMALANIAVLLAQMGNKVLIVDWDLEAPGIDRFFSLQKLQPAEVGGGLMFELQRKRASKQGNEFDISRFPQGSVCTVATLPSGDTITILPSGDDVPSYSATVAAFSWADFFSRVFWRPRG